MLILQFESGWFSHQKINCFRQRLMVRYLAIFPKPGAENLLKAATSKFEKLKRECSRNATKLDGEECQQANSGYVISFSVFSCFFILKLLQYSNRVSKLLPRSITCI